MAPGLIETTSTVPASSYTKGSAGPKEAFIGGPQIYNSTAEIEGTTKQPPATHPKYLPVWDAKTKYDQLRKQCDARMSLTRHQDTLH